MATFKFFVVLATTMTAAWAGVFPARPWAIPAPVLPAVPILKASTDYDPHPQYTYGYDVHDSITGDSKFQQETRNGDVVNGRYSLIEPDGTRRIVEYTADSINGFNAVVHREPAIVRAVPAAVPVAVGPPVVPQVGPALFPSYAKPAPAIFPAPLGHRYAF